MGMTSQRAKALRQQLTFLTAELALCRTLAEVRCVKQTIRATELELSR